jgi:hypothetical protein
MFFNPLIFRGYTALLPLGRYTITTQQVPVQHSTYTVDHLSSQSIIVVNNSTHQRFNLDTKPWVDAKYRCHIHIIGSR